MDRTASRSTAHGATPDGWHVAQRMPDRALLPVLTRRYTGYTETAPLDGPWTEMPTGTVTMILNVADCRAELPDGFVAGLTDRSARWAVRTT